MIGRTIVWWRERSVREQRLLGAMLIVALPVLAWLLVVRPLTSAYAAADLRYAEAVARYGRIAARIGAIEAGGSAAAALAPGGAALDLVVAEAASQSGLTLDRNDAAGPDAVDVAIARATPAAAIAWLAGFEGRGIVVADMRMANSADGTVSLTAKLTRSAAR